MPSSNPLQADATVVVDTNIFYAIGAPSNPKYQRFRKAVRDAGIVLKLPSRVITELGGEETTRIQQAIDDGWAEIVEAPDPSESDAVRASDIARRTIASKTNQPEHEVEKTDTILAGIAVQYLQTSSAPDVIVLTDDQPAKVGIETAVSELGYEDTLAVYELADIIDESGGDSIRVL